MQINQWFILLAADFDILDEMRFTYMYLKVKKFFLRHVYHWTHCQHNYNFLRDSMKTIKKNLFHLQVSLREWRNASQYWEIRSFNNGTETKIWLKLIVPINYKREKTNSSTCYYYFRSMRKNSLIYTRVSHKYFLSAPF